jgi:hypothetical protein
MVSSTPDNLLIRRKASNRGNPYFIKFRDADFSSA